MWLSKKKEMTAYLRTILHLLNEENIAVSFEADPECRNGPAGENRHSVRLAQWCRGSSPDDSTFEKAGVWRVTLPKNMPPGLSDVFLDINYAGDVGRLYDGKRLLDDNFFNGTSWEVGLKRFSPDLLSHGFESEYPPAAEGCTDLRSKKQVAFLQWNGADCRS